MARFFGLWLMFLGAGVVTACASMVSTPNQNVQVLTPGADGARCVLSSDYARYVAHPPETIFMRRMQEPLKVTCKAPGNRERTTYVYARRNGSAMGNVMTAGAGAVYDHFSGALYKYPSPIVVDFRHTIATKNALPTYHAADTVAPMDQNPEQVKGNATQVPFGDTPAPLIEPEKSVEETLPEVPGQDPAKPTEVMNPDKTIDKPSTSTVSGEKASVKEIGNKKTSSALPASGMDAVKEGGEKPVSDATAAPVAPVTQELNK